MTTTSQTARSVTAPGPTVSGRRRGLIVTGLIGLIALLIPSGFAFAQSWQTSADATRTSAAELAGLAYLRPLSTLLAALVNAEAAAARGVAVDAAGVRLAIEEVNRVDQLHGDELLARQRWAALPEQIETALKAAPSGPAALNGYAISIGLTKTLLTAVASTSAALRDEDPTAAALIEVHVSNVSDIMVQAGSLVALARSRPSQPSAVAVARDRTTDAASRLGPQLRVVGGSDVDPGATILLAQVDQLTSAVLGITQASAEIGVPSPAGLLRIDEAQARVHQAAVTLGATLLSTFDSVLTARAAAGDRQRVVLIAGAAAQGVGAAGLFWVFVALARRPQRTRASADQPATPTGVKPLSAAGQVYSAGWE